jgi:hypothetical protein
MAVSHIEMKNKLVRNIFKLSQLEEALTSRNKEFEVLEGNNKQLVINFLIFRCIFWRNMILK